MPTALAMMQAERAKYAEKLGRLKLDDIHQLLDLMDIVPRGSGSKVPSSLLDIDTSSRLLPRYPFCQWSAAHWRAPWRWLRAADCMESGCASVWGEFAPRMVCQGLTAHSWLKLRSWEA